jgi:hypothetical protein
VGQRTALTQVGVADDGVADPETVTRVVSWGDGTSSILSAGQGPMAKQYTRAGTYPVTFTLTDAAGNSTVTTSRVTVTVPGRYRLNTTSVWPGHGFSLTISGVPAGTTKITLDWGDGWVVDYKGANQTVWAYYYHRKNGGPLIRGVVTLRLTFIDKNGTSSWINAGRGTVKTDKWAPVGKASKGKWSMKLGGVKKGALYVDVRTWDHGDNAGKWSSIKVKITS